MRTLEEIKAEVEAAMAANDATTLENLVEELATLDATEAQALRFLAKGVAERLRGDYRKALEYLELALELYKDLGDKTGLARVTNNVGLVYCSIGNYSKALEYYEQALALQKELGVLSGITAITGNIGIVYRSTGDYPKALEYYEQALALYNVLGEKHGIAIVTGNIGNVYNKIGNYPTALQFYEQALAMHKELGVKSGIAIVTGNIGSVYNSTGNYPKALEYYVQALALYKDLGEKSGIALVTGNIGIVYASTSNYPKALEYYEQALAMHKELGNKPGIASVTDNIGIMYAETGDYPKALEYFEQALAMHKELGEKSGIAHVTGNIGSVHIDTGDYPKALEYYEQALALHKELGQKSGIAGVTANIIACLLKQGDDIRAQKLLKDTDALDIDNPSTRINLLGSSATLLERGGNLDEAAETLIGALTLATEAGLRSEEASCHERLRDLARKRNDFDGYIQHNNEFTRINEEIRGKEATLKIGMMEAEKKILADKKEREKEKALLYGALPKSVADRMIKGEDVSGDHFQSVSVLFLDIAGFTALCDTIPPAHVVHLLKQIFAALDTVSNEFGLTKIKTIGDSYMAACGLPDITPDHTTRTAHAALKMISALRELTVTMPQGKGDTSWTKNAPEINVRIGLHCGPVTAGVIGSDRLQYDVWGDTVNVASRMESTGEPGRIHISSAFAESLQGNGSLTILPRGEVTVKGKGTINTFWLEAGSSC